ncbi:MAG: hypothetical protein AABM66_04905 [Actinomycetota bacterium]
MHQALVPGAVVRILVEDAQWIGFLLGSGGTVDKPPVVDPSNAPEAREPPFLIELHASGVAERLH